MPQKIDCIRLGIRSNGIKLWQVEARAGEGERSTYYYWRYGNVLFIELFTVRSQLGFTTGTPAIWGEGGGGEIFIGGDIFRSHFSNCLSALGRVVQFSVHSRSHF